METHRDQNIFSNYDDYVNYQVNKCVTPVDHPYYKGVFESHIEIVSKYLGNLKRDIAILDCGCGYGFALQAFRHSGYNNVIGTDISDSRLTEALKVGYPLLKLDIHLMRAIKDSVFDLVYSSHSLEHALYPDRALAEIYRILKPGGIFMLILPYPVVLDDDHLKKAHCGATYLNLTIEDDGLGLINIVKEVGFSLLSRGTGTYRNEEEIYLKFIKKSIAPFVIDYGPIYTLANTKFNVQPNGMSALWFTIEDPYNADLVVKFDGHILKTVRHRNILSALVPDSLIVYPRSSIISVFDIDRPHRNMQMGFKIVGPVGIPIKKSAKSASSMTRKPNFFIIGAPRSATTSLYWKLADHPEVYMPRIKEPSYFDKRAHGVLSHAVSTEEEYLALFQYAPFQAKMIGEASVTYLSSSEALQKIRDFNNDAKIIAILRDPIEASISMYLRTLQGGKYEHSPNFETAWRQPYDHDRPFVTRYAELFQIGNQLQTALSIFGESNFKVFLFDDLIKESSATYHEILRFLQLPIDSDKPLLKGNSADWEDIHKHVPMKILNEMIEYYSIQVKIVSSYTKRNLDHWLAK